MPGLRHRGRLDPVKVAKIINDQDHWNNVGVLLVIKPRPVQSEAKARIQWQQLWMAINEVIPHLSFQGEAIHPTSQLLQ